MADGGGHGGFDELASGWSEFARHRAPRLPADMWALGVRSAANCARVLPPESYPTIIELGCGPARTTRWLAPSYERVFAVDIAPGMLDSFEAPANVTQVLDDGTNLVEKIGLVDGLLSDVVLMHNRHDDVRRIMVEIGRVLRPGGRAAIQLPIYDVAVEPADWRQVGQWTLEQFRQLADAAGLTVAKAWTNPGSCAELGEPGENHFKLHVLDKRV